MSVQPRGRPRKGHSWDSASGCWKRNVGEAVAYYPKKKAARLVVIPSRPIHNSYNSYSYNSYNSYNSNSRDSSIFDYNSNKCMLSSTCDDELDDFDTMVANNVMRTKYDEEDTSHTIKLEEKKGKLIDTPVSEEMRKLMEPFEYAKSLVNTLDPNVQVLSIDKNHLFVNARSKNNPYIPKSSIQTPKFKWKKILTTALVKGPSIEYDLEEGEEEERDDVVVWIKIRVS